VKSYLLVPADSESNKCYFLGDTQMAKKAKGRQTGIPEGFKFVRGLTNEDGWRYLHYMKGLETLNAIGEQVKALRHQGRAMTEAGQRLIDRGAELAELAEEKVKRIQAEQQNWQSLHGRFIAELDIPQGMRVQEDPDGDRFVLIEPLPKE
jgi:hypothetical protein